MVLPYTRTVPSLRLTPTARSATVSNRWRMIGVLALASVLCWISLLTYMQWTLDEINRGVVVIPAPSQPQLLSVAQHQYQNGDIWNVTCVVTTDVRGNLGPADVLLTNGTDWIRDRWQAASDMHGTNIQGEHWVQLTWKSSESSISSPLRQMMISRIVLDWEAAYADHYDIQLQSTATGIWDTTKPWQTIATSPQHLVDSKSASRNSTTTAITEPTIHVATAGQSPGVDSITPLHVIHDIHLPPLQFFDVSSSLSLRLTIHKSATGWGVSLWQIQVYGMYI